MVGTGLSPPRAGERPDASVELVGDMAAGVGARPQLLERRERVVDPALALAEIGPQRQALVGEGHGRDPAQDGERRRRTARPGETEASPLHRHRCRERVIGGEQIDGGRFPRRRLERPGDVSRGGGGIAAGPGVAAQPHAARGQSPDRFGARARG